ncbi:MAG: hypothetical protein ABIP17_13890 [Ilumatobacteraceae bacterium]
MMTSMVGDATRWRQAIALALPSTRVVKWQPMAQVMLFATLFVILGSSAGLLQRLSMAGVAVAAASAFVLDDTAAITLAAVPTSLPVRRFWRVAATVVAITLWWSAAVAVATHRVGSFPLRGRALELIVFVTTALAVSAIASTVGDRIEGGIAGAVIVGVCYGLTLLPPWRWLPFPAHPDAAGAHMRLLMILAGALTLLTWASRDPARRPLRRESTSRRHHSAT